MEKSTFLRYDQTIKHTIDIATWGHLAPNKNTYYKGSVLLSVDECGNCEVIDYIFEDLEDNPFIWSFLNEFFNEESFKKSSCYKIEVVFYNYTMVYVPLIRLSL